jgi:hypothetical protein
MRSWSSAKMIAAARSRRFSLGEHVVDVGLDRALPDRRAAGDLGAGVALPDQAEHLAFPAAGPADS